MSPNVAWAQWEPARRDPRRAVEWGGGAGAEGVGMTPRGHSPPLFVPLPEVGQFCPSGLSGLANCQSWAGWALEPTAPGPVLQMKCGS